jgi:hypothetical protein
LRSINSTPHERLSAYSNFALLSYDDSAFDQGKNSVGSAGGVGIKAGTIFEDYRGRPLAAAFTQPEQVEATPVSRQHNLRHNLR